MQQFDIRHDWTLSQAQAIYQLPFMDLLWRAQQTHRLHFDASELQLSTLMSIKTGACPEDCGYCSQSGHHKTNLDKQKLLPLEEVIATAKAAKASGATRFCMGAAWRSPPKKDFPQVIAMIKAVKELGLESCVTLGMLDDEQVAMLKESGLDYYNHNIDTSESHYEKVITTRTFRDRLDTLSRVRDSGINVCCGGILGLGETQEDRLSMLCSLANMPSQPESVPINKLVPIPGTPLGDTGPVDDFDFVRCIATARIMLPKSMLRLSAGRETMNAALQAWCFFAGANSIFYGDELLTTNNSPAQQDQALMRRLGMRATALPCAQQAVTEVDEITA